MGDVSCRLLEVDYTSAESLVLGWYMRSPTYMRLSRLGIYAAVIGQMIGTPPDMSRSDEELHAFLKALKLEHKAKYDLTKRVVLGSGYGLTPYGMTEQFPEYFPTQQAAEEIQRYYHRLAPEVPEWQRRVQTRAKTMGYLGGPTPVNQVPSEWDHPYGYRRWFWDVLSYQPTDEWTARKWRRSEQWKRRIVSLHGRPFKVRLGGDAKRAIAFYPQSTTSGRLKEAEIDLLHPDSPEYMGDAYFGRTPLLAPIHDALLFIIPNRCFDRVVEIVLRVMQRPSPYLQNDPAWGLGTHLAISVEAKTGKDWASMEPLTFGEQDSPVLPATDVDSLDEWQALRRAV